MDAPTQMKSRIRKYPFAQNGNGVCALPKKSPATSWRNLGTRNNPRILFWQRRAAPIRVFDHADGLQLYLVGNGSVQQGPLILHIHEFTSWPLGMPVVKGNRVPHHAARRLSAFSISRRIRDLAAPISEPAHTIQVNSCSARCPTRCGLLLLSGRNFALW